MSKTSNNIVKQTAASLWQNSGMLVVFIILFVIASVLVPGFCSSVNMTGLALAIATVGMVACTMMFCLASGDFDMSVGSVVAFAAVASVMVTNATHSAVIGILAGMAIGTVVGIINGFVIAKVGINALITTLATMQMARGGAYLICGGQAVGVKVDSFNLIGNTSLDNFKFMGFLRNIPGLSILLDLSTPVWITIACFFIFGFILNKTTFGRNTLAIGGNKDAARLAGVAVERTKIIIFAMQGLVAGFAGAIIASRFTSGQPNSATGLELQAISACVLGGVSMSGGIATILGVVVGVFIMGTVQNVMDLKNIDTYWQMVTTGIILLTVVIFDRYKQMKSV